MLKYFILFTFIDKSSYFLSRIYWSRTCR